jgi:inorganic triphosphatase YgiF
MLRPREIELKLGFHAAALRRLKENLRLKCGARLVGEPVHMVSTYFDTDGLALHRGGLSLRLRQVGARRLQTVKRESTAGGVVMDRGEWETEVSSNQPNLDAVCSSAIKPKLIKKLRRDLKPMFETRVHRTLYSVENGDSEIELAIDEGEIVSDSGSVPLSEVELELKRGEVTDLFRLARSLVDAGPIQLAVRSKAERGYAMITAAAPEPVKAVPIAIKPGTNTAKAFQIIARACLYQIAANCPAVVAGHADGVHQMRVGLRRIRAALTVFSSMLSDPQTSALKSELRWITGELGPAREMAVFAERAVEPLVNPTSEEDSISELTTDVQQRRADAETHACRAVESQRFGMLLLDLAAWIEAGDWITNDDHTVHKVRQTSIKCTAVRELQRRWKEILKKGKHLDDLDPPRRHRLRISTKKLRYASEFFACLFPGPNPKRRRKAFISHLEKLQDALGELNDIAVHERLSAQIADDTHDRRRRARTKKVFAAGRVSGHEEARAAPLLVRARQAHDTLSRVRRFWSAKG